MRLKLTSGATKVLASGLIILSFSSLAFAGGACRRCNVCPNGVNGGDFFGYYPTNWRPWPGITVTSVQERIQAPAPQVMPSAPSTQPAPAPKSTDKPPEETSSQSSGDLGTKADQQPYFAPPQ